MLSEECKKLYNKLNTFVTKVINRDIQPQIDSLNTSITNLTTTETTTITPSNVSGADNIYFTLRGDGIVSITWINGSVTCSSSSNGTSILLGTLPEKYRPRGEKWFSTAYGLHLDKGRHTSLKIAPNGQVTLHCWWTGTNQAIPCVFTGIYALF